MWTIFLLLYFSEFLIGFSIFHWITEKRLKRKSRTDLSMWWWCGVTTAAAASAASAVLLKSEYLVWEAHSIHAMSNCM